MIKSTFMKSVLLKLAAALVITASVFMLYCAWYLESNSTWAELTEFVRVNGGGPAFLSLILCLLFIPIRPSKVRGSRGGDIAYPRRTSVGTPSEGYSSPRQAHLGLDRDGDITPDPANRITDI